MLTLLIRVYAGFSAVIDLLGRDTAPDGCNGRQEQGRINQGLIRPVSLNLCPGEPGTGGLIGLHDH